MSTDDSISEDVSSSAALSHGHVSADGGKESETSLVSSEGTSAVSEGRHRSPQKPRGTEESRTVDRTPACNTIRSLCLNSDVPFEGKNLPFINPSPLDTLRALVQEIQSSGEMDPGIWKDCESRWLHLFQLVEKQYQEQILAQQEQYQCQIQLIQDEIKALVQIQNRQSSTQPLTELPPRLLTRATADTRHTYVLPHGHGGRVVPKNAAGDGGTPAAPVPGNNTLSPPDLGMEAIGQREERAATVLSSGYGTLNAWEAGVQPEESPGGDADEDGRSGEQGQWGSEGQKEKEETGLQQQDCRGEGQGGGKDSQLEENTQQKTSGFCQQLTSWAQRQKLRTKKSKSEQVPCDTPTDQNQPASFRELSTQPHPEAMDYPAQLQHPPAGSSSLPLFRSDSLMSEASGLTYWRSPESELYRDLPDTFDRDAFLLLQEQAKNLESHPTLRDIYQNKQRDNKQLDWEGSAISLSLSPQVLTLDPGVGVRPSDRTSGFTSPSHFSSPSPVAQPHPDRVAGTSATPDSMAEYSPNPGNTDCISDASSGSTSGPGPCKKNRSHSVLSTVQTEPSASQHHTAGHLLTSQEEGSGSSTVMPGPVSTAPLRLACQPRTDRGRALEDPIVLSLVRQNLKEKHSRHVADLKAYYEAEIQILQDKLNLRDLPKDLEKSNQALTERCKDLENTLDEATRRIQDLEETNKSLEQKLSEWPERYAVTTATVASLQQRLEESKRSGKEKDTLMVCMKKHVQQLEEAAQKTRRDRDEKEARRDKKYKMLQQLLGEYESLSKEHESVKKDLVSTENKLMDASDQIAELKRIVCKLESQVKQLQRENQNWARYTNQSRYQQSGPGLFHHPDLSPPLKSPTEPATFDRKSPRLSEQRIDTSPQFPHNHQQSFQRSPPPTSAPARTVDALSAAAPGVWRYTSPPEYEPDPPPHSRQQEAGAARKEGGSSPLTPLMRALIELEETKATEARAPWADRQRPTVGFMERKHKELLREQAELLQQEVEAGAERGGSRAAAERRGAALLRAQRSLSPDGHRSSSLPPPVQRSMPLSTPTKRETLLAPLSAKSSPKRCPTENFSTAFGLPLPREEHLLLSLDGHMDRRRHSFHSGSPRRRLHFLSADRDALKKTATNGGLKSPVDRGDARLRGSGDLQDRSEEPSIPTRDRPETLAEAERIFDELTQEKLMIEAALSRIPGSGGRVSLQTRLDQVTLEKRLERINSELGSVRMFLKRFHVLRSSAPI